MAKVTGLPETSLWSNWKCLLICAAVAVANMQYGLDSSVMASLQPMPGFLVVFGYEDPSQSGGYAIECSSFVPESPRYLLHRGNEEAARKALETLRGNSMQGEELQLEWVEMVKGIDEEKRTASSVGPLDMFRGTELRRTLLCCGVIATQTGSGAWFVISYATYFMVVAGVSVDDAFKYSVMNTCLGLIGVNLGIYLMRHVMGRRTVLMTGAAVQGCVMLGLAVSATAASGTAAARRCVIAFIALFIWSYNAFVGDASYPAATELVSTRLRSWSVGSATSLGYFLAWLTGFCSPYFINPENLDWGAKYGYIWAGSNFCCFVFFYLFLPETKGCTLEEIDELFANRVSVRNFRAFKTSIMEDALKDVNKDKEDDAGTQFREVGHSVLANNA
ncbi:hypothetical protein DL766_001451 [Monosporascus sp. MC13-8B]|uniref:Major facilitator superfamily (MFS) profile domain-containing protein n=1 Tax=Monosporascus cannonballus TaxID=155416 RepID=A0ABY0HBL9_9PEZI|nr:hypothetical protein DL762_003087 [Monosporascus cannonballus]RYP00452.1 hypothetical protein DL763_000804 [Monosporascus cannonballus]RYP37635.1 hypothetical protein DL766_001451 [Monosporascus sp. MC13-8B]